MRNAIAQLQARVLKFLLQAVKWYKQGKISHTFGAIAKPWALNFKENTESIAEQSRYIDELSSIASKAELRDTHISLVKARVDIQDVRMEIRCLADLVSTRTNQLVQSAKGEKYNLQIDLILTVCVATEALHNQMRLTIPVERETLGTNKVLALPQVSVFENVPSPESTLSYCQSLLRRTKTQTHLSPSQMALLQQWATSSRSSLLILDSSHRDISKRILIDMLGLLNTSRKPLIWALRFPDYWHTEIKSTFILIMLVTQALLLNPLPLTQAPNPLTSDHFVSASSDKEWFGILNKALSAMPQLFIGLDAALLAAATDNSKYRTTRWLELLMESINTTSIKVFVTQSSVDEEYIARNWGLETWVKVGAAGTGNGPGGKSRKRSQRSSHHRKKLDLM
jgi:hypothetical protein